MGTSVRHFFSRSSLLRACGPDFTRTLVSNTEPYLAKFKGKPGQLSPKARLLMFAGWLLPSRFKQVSIHLLLPLVRRFLTFDLVSNSTEAPFDRHDWIVHRPQTGEEVRYIIDYYSAPPLPDGSPVFSLDVRPALDSIPGVQARVNGWKEIWSSAATREKEV